MDKEFLVLSIVSQIIGQRAPYGNPNAGQSFSRGAEGSIFPSSPATARSYGYPPAQPPVDAGFVSRIKLIVRLALELKSRGINPFAQPSQDIPAFSPNPPSIPVRPTGEASEVESSPASQIGDVSNLKTKDGRRVLSTSPMAKKIVEKGLERCTGRKQEYYCWGGVCDALANAYGRELGIRTGSAKDGDDALAANPEFVEIDVSGLSPSDLYNLPAGAMIFQEGSIGFDAGHGHAQIKLSGAQACSDHIEWNMYLLHSNMVNNEGKPNYRVFVPKDMVV